MSGDSSVATEPDSVSNSLPESRGEADPARPAKGEADQFREPSASESVGEKAAGQTGQTGKAGKAGKPKKRVVVLLEPEDEHRHDGGSHLESAVASFGRTPRFKDPVARGTHTVDSTDGVKLCVKTWPAEKLEADPAAAPKQLLIVLVHQYSVMGGCQDLVVGLARHLNKLQFSCVTFDQRGVGQSTGAKSVTGIPEVEDVVSVCEWAAAQYGRRMLLLGSSAGAPIAGSALDRVNMVEAFVAVGYVFGFWASILFGSHFQKVLTSPKPKFFIMGTKDGFTTPRQLEEKLSKAQGLVKVHLIQGFGHFEIESPVFDEPLAKLAADFVSSLP